MNEFGVLCELFRLTNNKRKVWCPDSKDKIADWLDLSIRTVYNIFNSLEERGYIERSVYGVKPTKFIYDLEELHTEITPFIKSKEVDIVSEKVKSLIKHKLLNQ